MLLKRIFSTLMLIAFVVMPVAAFGYDRFGGDIANPLVTTPTECAKLCDANSGCQSWTFVKPPIKHPTSAVCFLKSSVPSPAFNSTCRSNNLCLSGVKSSSGQWCGESPAFTQSGVLMGQGEVVACGPGRACRPISSNPRPAPPWCIFVLWIPSACQPAAKIQTIDFFCQ